MKDDSDDLVLQKHKEFCLALNMDAISGDRAWESYSEIRKIYTLEVSLIGKIVHFVIEILLKISKLQMTAAVKKSSCKNFNSLFLCIILLLNILTNVRILLKLKSF